MTSTVNERPKVYFEAPNFGFGPMSTTLSLISRLKDRFDCTVVSTGAALRLARDTLCAQEFIDVDSFDPGRWLQAEASVGRGTLILSNTNPQFAAWMAARGHRVGVFDTLYWMWDSLPAAIGRVEFYVAQWYFGVPVDRSPQPSVPIVFTAPLLPERLRSAAPVGGSAVITLGGMGLPFDPGLPLRYARWICGNIVPHLRAAGCRVAVVGGHPELRSALEGFDADPAVELCGALPQEDYLARIAAAEHVFATPGLSTIYEMAWLNRETFWLPPYSMSMLLQRHHYLAFEPYENFGYQWPWAGIAVDQVATLPEEQGVGLVAAQVSACLNGGTDVRERLMESAKRYLERSPERVSNMRHNSVLPSQPLEDAVKVVAAGLSNAAVRAPTCWGRD